jgi:hypothetical protein
LGTRPTTPETFLSDPVGEAPHSLTESAIDAASASPDCLRRGRSLRDMATIPFGSIPVHRKRIFNGDPNVDNFEIGLSAPEKWNFIKHDV